MPINHGFEDREGHQAPFTLQIANCQFPIADWKTFGAPVGSVILFGFLDPANDLIELGPIAGLKLGMHEIPIGANFKCATARWNEGKRLDPLAEFEDLCRQTDGFRRVVSNHTIFNRNFGFHLALLSAERVRTTKEAVKRAPAGLRAKRKECSRGS